MMAKRLFDIFCALFGAAFFSPLLLLITLLIKLEDGGPIFFSQPRLGKNQKPFSIKKFRSMRDGKVTKVGRWLRSTGLDEVMQFINVLKGEMSMVGPRPLTEQDIRRLDWHHGNCTRFKVKPGITGLSQLYAGKGFKLSRFLDQKYTEQMSLLLDIKIIGLSFFINILGKRRVKTIIALQHDRKRSHYRKTKNAGKLNAIYKLAGIATVLFFGFILWVIFMADTGQHIIFFELVAAIPYGDKFGHILLFGLLVLGANIATKFKSKKVYGIKLYIGTAAVTLFVIGEELSQYLMPTRTLDAMDLCADFIGIACFTLISIHIKKRIMK